MVVEIAGKVVGTSHLAMVACAAHRSGVVAIAPIILGLKAIGLRIFAKSS